MNQDDLERLLGTWPANVADAVKVQRALRHRARLENDFAPLRTIAGVDVSYDIRNHVTRAVIVVMNYDGLTASAPVTSLLPTDFPYVPGFLSFREIPAILHALRKLPQLPDLFMVDGQGIAHPRRLGIAAHLGILLDKPAIGVAKSRLTGHYTEPDLHKGAITPLMDKQEQIGTVLRSKDKVKPLFISPGHRVDQAAAVQIVMHCLTRYRLPEPTRLADKASKIWNDEKQLVLKL